MFKNSLLIIFLLTLGLPIGAETEKKPLLPKKLNILIWGGTIDPTLINKFERETGITVNVNLLDSDESIEAKLLTGEAGFDIITPTLSPFYLRQMELGLYRKITREDVPNIALIKPEIINMFKTNNLSFETGIPLSWGTVGYVYHVEKVKQAFDQKAFPGDSWSLIYDLENIKKLSPCGVHLLDDSIEIFFSVYFYKGANLNIRSPKTIDALADSLFNIIDFVKKFDSSTDTIVNTIAGEKACVIQCFSGEALKAIHMLKKKGQASPYRYVEPKEGFSVWLDMMGVPKNATNPENAFKFINFLLRPENAAINYQYSMQPPTIEGFEQFLTKDFQETVRPFPEKRGLQTFGFNRTLNFRQTKKISNAWLRLRLGIK
jgi:putrescine transport system substrate-binding protein